MYSVHILTRDFSRLFSFSVSPSSPETVMYDETATMDVSGDTYVSLDYIWMLES